jgi:hypothetical protein
VVRGTQPSSPDMGGKTDAKTGGKTGNKTGNKTGSNTGASTGAGSPSNPKLRDTTFSTGVGERIDGTQTGSQSGPRRGKAAIVFVVAAAAAVGAGVFIFRDGEKAGVQHEIASAPVSPAAPSATTAPTVAPPPAPVPAPVVPAKPVVPKTVTVHVESDPAGANVVDDASGGILGVTPLVLNRPRGGALKLRLEKDGYTPNAHAISLSDDQTIELTLEHKPIKAVHVHKSHASAPGESEPAKL